MTSSPFESGAQRGDLNPHALPMLASTHVHVGAAAHCDGSE
jgi:hypothetical protein